MRALIVEDQRQMRNIVRKMLQQMKFFQVVDEAEDGERGWERINKSAGSGGYDVVVCDVYMPSLDGIELLKRCRSHPAVRFTPFIMISASSQGAVVTSALGEWGANDFIVKPFSFDLLNQRVSALLKRIQNPEEILYREAEQFLAKGQSADALKIITKWEVDNRLSRAKWTNLKGECLLEMGETDRAAKEFENAMTLSNIFIAAFKNYASSHEKLGNIDKAIKALKYVEEISPVDHERTLKLGRNLLQAGQEDEGRKVLDGLVKRVAPEQKEAILRKVGEVFNEGGLFFDAERVYVVVLQVNPSDIDMVNRLGIALRQQGKFDEAEKCYVKALKANPNHPGLYHNLGMLYVTKKALDKARRCFLKALDLDSGFEEAGVMLERVEQKMRKA